MTHERSLGKMSNMVSTPSRIRIPAGACLDGVLRLETTIGGMGRQIGKERSAI